MAGVETNSIFASLTAVAERRGKVCVLHLVRQANGVDPFRRFLDSYRRHAAGVDHELVLIFKGFANARSTEPYRSLVTDVATSSLNVADVGFDLGSYVDAARTVTFDRLCFVNSFTEVETDDWLGLLVSGLDDRGTGLAGATGSWGSHASHLRYDLGLGGPYARVYADRAETRALFHSLASTEPEPSRCVSVVKKAVVSSTQMARTALGANGFPAPHVRTNTFAISRDLFLRVGLPQPRDKLDAHLIESGRRSLTRRVQRTGLQAVVIGRDGQRYPPGEWPQSETFWQHDQENLLVSDRQTRMYQNGSAKERVLLSRYAWGPQAEPAVDLALAAARDS